jgi:hypothetical protein
MPVKTLSDKLDERREQIEGDHGGGRGHAGRLGLDAVDDGAGDRREARLQLLDRRL